MSLPVEKMLDFHTNSLVCSYKDTETSNTGVQHLARTRKGQDTMMCRPHPRRQVRNLPNSPFYHHHLLHSQEDSQEMGHEHPVPSQVSLLHWKKKSLEDSFHRKLARILEKVKELNECSLHLKGRRKVTTHGIEDGRNQDKKVEPTATKKARNRPGTGQSCSEPGTWNLPF